MPLDVWDSDDLYTLWVSMIMQKNTKCNVTWTLPTPFMTQYPGKQFCHILEQVHEHSKLEFI